MPGPKMPGFKRVLVAIDFSDCAWEVCERALAVAEPAGAEVILAHVAELPEGVAPETRVHRAGRTDQALQLLQDAARDRLDGYAALFRDRGLTVHHDVRGGPVDAALLAAIEETGADLLVMGTHGRKGVSRAFLGSVADKLVRQAPVPVMTMRTTWKKACKASSCAWCTTHVMPEQEEIADEAMG